MWRKRNASKQKLPNGSKNHFVSLNLTVCTSYRNNHDMKGEEIPEIERLQDEVLIRKEVKKAPFIDLGKSIVFLFSIYTRKSARDKKHGT